MIEITNFETIGWEAVIRGMRNAMNSCDKSDSWFFDYTEEADEFDRWPALMQCHDICDNRKTLDPAELFYADDDFVIGPNDMALMRSLVKAGEKSASHAKFRRMIVVYIDILAPLYWWKEFDTYKVDTVVNSTSAMHKIHSKEFELNDFSHENIIAAGADDIQDKGVDYYCAAEVWKDEDSGVPQLVSPTGSFVITVKLLNRARELYLQTEDKKYWWQMIQLLPSNYNQKRTVMLNYEVLATIYRDRRDDKLDEWREFCGWIARLPYAKELILPGECDEESYSVTGKDLYNFAVTIIEEVKEAAESGKKVVDVSIKEAMKKAGIGFDTV